MKKTIIYLYILSFSFLSGYAQLDRSKVPQPGPAPKIQIGQFTKFELANGLKVFVVENHKLPRVAYSLSLIITPELEGKNSGIGSITADLIGTGTKTRTKDQINEETDFISASFSANSEGIYASSLKKHTEKLLDLVSDITINSVFTSEELEKARTQTLSGLASQKDNPDAIANNISSAVIYGKNHPYGEFETENSVKNITLDMCNQYYKKYFNPNVAYLTVIGDITPKEAKKLVEKYFGKWQKKDVPAIKYNLNPAPDKNRVIIVDRPQSVQSVINVCYPVDLSLNNPDYIKAYVTNTVLGGGIFRLFLNLREKHAYTYGAYSNFRTNPLGSRFKASTKVRNSVTDSAVYQILYEMDRMRNEPVPADELQMVKNYVTGDFALSLEDPETVASFAVNTERYGLPKDFYTNYLKNVESVTAADVQATAKKYILPDHSNILVVGKASEIAEPLKKFSANGEILYFDKEANQYDPSKQKKAAPAGITAGNIIDKYIEVVGGKANIDKIKDLTLKGTFSMQGMKLSINMYYKIPGKYMNEIIMNGQPVQKQIYNNGTGKSSGMQGNKTMEGEELEKFKLESEIVQELKYSALGYKSELKEIASVNGEDAYVVEITSPSGNISQDYFSVATGLKIRSVSTMDTPNGKITQTSDIKEYIDVDGLKLAKKITVSAGGQNFEIVIDSTSVNSGIKDEIFE